MGILRRTTLAATSVLVCVVLALTLGSPAGAHSKVQSTDPAAGDIVNQPVDQITIVFSEVAEPVGDGFRVVEADGSLRPPDRTRTSDGLTWILNFDPPLANGQAGFLWSIKAGDAHVYEGSITFIVAAPEPEPEAEPQPESTTADDGSASLRVADAEATGPTATGPPVAADPGDGDPPAGPVAISEDGAMTSIEVDVAEAGLVDDLAGRIFSPHLVSAIGRAMTTLGTMVAVGGLIFLLRLLRGTSSEGHFVLTVIRRSALVIAGGVGLELIGQIAVESGEWTSLFSPAAVTDFVASRFGAAAVLRLIGVFGLVTGSYFRREPIGEQDSEVIMATMATAGVLAAAPRAAVATDDHPSPDVPQPATAGYTTPLLNRWHPVPASSGAMLGAVAVLAAPVIDGHSLNGPSPLFAAFATLTHVLAGSVWLGGVIILLSLVRRRFQVLRRVEAVDLAVRYSVWAAGSLVAVGLAGLALTINSIDSISQLWSTAWGRLVVAKMTLVLVAGLLGAVNHFFLLPGLVKDSESVRLGESFRRVVTVEVVVLFVVVMISAVLVALAV